jgi:RimJ/RimL family protein N-acetyltransferase
MVNSFQIIPVSSDDKAWITSLLKEWWAGPLIVTRGKLHLADELPGFIAVHDGMPAGLITYDVVGDECEIVTMNSLVENRGIGTALISAVSNIALKAGCRRIWLITTNDNTAALRFYQKKCFSLVAVHRNAIERSRQLKPEIPETGNDGIPLRDEIELEIVLG